MEFAQRSDLYYAIQSKKKMDELLEELKKYEFIGYKFLEKYKKLGPKYGPYFTEGTFFNFIL
jgi:hypothetical protein